MMSIAYYFLQGLQTIIYCLPFITLVHGLKLITTPEITMVYTDVGTGARLGITVYGPTLSSIPTGYYMVGMAAVPATNGAGNKQMLFLVNPESDPEAVTEPVGFNLIWKDSGSGGHMDGSFYSVNCTIPYVALGDVAVGSWSYPSDELKKKFACIHLKLVRSAMIGDQIWNDGGSGAYSDISVWETANKKNSSCPGLVGLFKATNSFSKPVLHAYSLPVSSI